MSTTDWINPQPQEPCGDYEDFTHLGQEVNDAIAFLLDPSRNPQFQNAQIILLGHSRGGISARAYLQGSFSNKSNVIALLTTDTPHQGSPLGNIYSWLSANPRHIYNSSGTEQTVPWIPPGSQTAIQMPANWQDWSVVDWLRSPTTIFGYLPKPPLDVRRPVIAELMPNSPDLSALNASTAIANLPTQNIVYGEIVYDEVSLGILAQQPTQYSVFNGILPPLIVEPLSNGAEAYVLGINGSGSANTVGTFHGDGMVPDTSAIFTTLPGFSGTRIAPLVQVNGTVVHVDEPSQIGNLLHQLHILSPNWFP